MRNVKRGLKPASLRRNAARWKRELLAEISRCQRTREPVRSRFFDRYRQEDVRDTLRQMYDNRCCYCEVTIRNVTYDQIEHRKPKAHFQGDTFKWDNLHLACPKCNGAKADQWDDDEPILDAVLDRPIDRDLTYLPSRTGLRRWPKTGRGDTTIRHTDLDRDDLPMTRVKIFLAAFQTIRLINMRHREDPGSATVSAAVRELRGQCQEDYGSVIAWAMTELLEYDDAAA